ncbi:hypothetical protein CLAFUW4_09991 [Fulvia fulva]|uniref:Putative effector 54 n=1 Tax=Passalora fulva TaxID=5499 RepID=A0A1P8YXT7_PASFU|nr:uncharacterized protein CLAFUR5_14678 [Fulvia fulva]AQA29257.1 putative effector 54 [Fulvia fulva]KAK4615617.1 hypothetical protein CLAFUR4_09995 [Fulvia fulva]KAK4616584.1 hypothetical protein CLAFUR0_09992 [Fulvia fulva]UJO22661.1 hypothetical protein CLAFUR5_14678 [Fulvia fulva]WPV19655.1 hypothetical protein CLAFUW4_09991 [Fulvia fulva]
MRSSIVSLLAIQLAFLAVGNTMPTDPAGYTDLSAPEMEGSTDLSAPDVEKSTDLSAPDVEKSTGLSAPEMKEDVNSSPQSSLCENLHIEVLGHRLGWCAGCKRLEICVTVLAETGASCAAAYVPGAQAALLACLLSIGVDEYEASKCTDGLC